MEFNFTQEVTKEEYLAFYRYHILKKFYSPVKIIAVVFFFLILFSGPFYGQWTMLYAGLALLAFIVFMIFKIKNTGGKIYDQDPESFQYEYVLTDVTCSFSTKDGKSTKMWSEFVFLFEDEQYVFIYTKQNRGLMFVKEKMEEEVVAFIKQKVESNKGSVLKKKKK